jgi:pSer/pThr/pTyr-binding forkhead associated (FHA) protein
MAECPACGREISSGERVCADCGTRLDGITESFPPIDAEIEGAEEHVEIAEGPVLVVRKGPEVGERFYIDRPQLTLGRDPESDIFLNDVTVSRQHAEINTLGGEVAIRDVDSLNGTYVNGVRVDAARLSMGDVVQIGTFQMVFAAGGDRQ